jgi:hypothetical protein
VSGASGTTGPVYDGTPDNDRVEPSYALEEIALLLSGGGEAAVIIGRIRSILSLVGMGGSEATGEATTSGGNVAGLPEAEAQQLADLIADGHAYDKHVIEREEFPDISSQDQFSDYIKDILRNPNEVKSLPRGRTAYWDDGSGTVVIQNPNDLDGGTAFRPPEGKSYFDSLKKE